MRGVDLDHPEAGLACSLSGNSERRDHFPDVLDAHRGRSRPAFRVWDRTRPECSPRFFTALCDVFRVDRCLTVPGAAFARLAARMGELDACNCSLLREEASDRREPVDVGVRPYPEVAMCTPAMLLHRSSLAEHQRGASECEPTEVDQVPVVRHAVLRAVLAHR